LEKKKVAGKTSDSQSKKENKGEEKTLEARNGEPGRSRTEGKLGGMGKAELKPRHLVLK